MPEMLLQNIAFHRLDSRTHRPQLAEDIGTIAPVFDHFFLCLRSARQCDLSAECFPDGSDYVLPLFSPFQRLTLPARITAFIQKVQPERKKNVPASFRQSLFAPAGTVIAAFVFRRALAVIAAGTVFTTAALFAAAAIVAALTVFAGTVRVFTFAHCFFSPFNTLYGYSVYIPHKGICQVKTFCRLS